MFTKSRLGLYAFIGAVAAVAQQSAHALTNSYSTAVALTSNVENAFDTGATIGLGILAFLIALAFVLKGIRVGHRG